MLIQIFCMYGLVWWDGCLSSLRQGLLFSSESVKIKHPRLSNSCLASQPLAFVFGPVDLLAQPLGREARLPHPLCDLARNLRVIFDSFFPITTSNKIQPISGFSQLNPCVSEDTGISLSQWSWVLPPSSLVSVTTQASWCVSWLLLSSVLCGLSNNPVPRHFSVTVFGVKCRVLSITSKALHRVASLVPLSFTSCPSPHRKPRPGFIELLHHARGRTAQPRWKFPWEACLDSRSYQILRPAPARCVITPCPSSSWLVTHWVCPSCLFHCHLQTGSPMGAETYLPSGLLYPLCLAQRLALCSVKYVGAQSVTLEMKILKLTFHDFLRPHNSLATIAVVSSTDLVPNWFKPFLCYLPHLSLSFLFYKMGVRPARVRRTKWGYCMLSARPSTCTL